MPQTLSDLFATSHSGEIKFAENQLGEIVFIEDVPNGIKCNCKCPAPACSQHLVAKNNGTIKDHHFAHVAGYSAEKCKSAGETALHKIAKKFLAEDLQLRLPALSAADGEITRTIPSKIFEFKSAKLEQRDGQIVPDVVVSHEGGSNLIVEFKVTHACDEAKIAKIKKLNIGAIEIDLSPYLEQPVDKLKDIILYKADRIWLHSPKLASLQKQVADEKQKHQDKLQQRTQVLLKRTHYNNLQAGDTNSKNQFELRLKNEFGIPWPDEPGSGCFRVRTSEWRAALMMLFLDQPLASFSLADIAKYLQKLDYLDAEFNGVSNEIATLLKEDHPPFSTPSESIESFLKTYNLFEKSSAASSWRLSQKLQNAVLKVQTEDDLKSKRVELLCRSVEAICEQLPGNDVGAFDFAEWLKSDPKCNNLSIDDCLRGSENNWQWLLQHLAVLKTKVWPKTFDERHILGLPLKEELKWQKTKQEADDKAEQAAKLAAEAARVSADKLEQEKERSAAHDVRKSKLLGQVTGICKDEIYAELWCRVTNPRFSFRKPYDFCDSDKKISDAIEEFRTQFKKGKRK